MDTWSSFRGTSCLCTNDRQCRWMGISPSGLGLRLKSRHQLPAVGIPFSGGGRKWPFFWVSDDLPFVAAAAVLLFDDEPLPLADAPFLEPLPALAGVSSPSLRVIIGLRLRVRARRSSDPLLSLLSAAAVLLLLSRPAPLPPPPVVFSLMSVSFSSSSYDSSSTGCGVDSLFLADRVIGPL